MASPPPSPGISGKPHFAFPERPSKAREIPVKTQSTSVCKTLAVVVLLLAILHFPSQAPDFITQTAIPSQFWEIIHMIFVGIAVSYGLFCRKTEKIEISGFDDADAHLSSISRLSSVFEHGFGNVSCGSDGKENVVMQDSFANCQCFGEQFSGKIKCVVHGAGSDRQIRSFVPRNGSENITNGFGNEENMMNETWSSEYLKTESLLVVSNGDNVLDRSLDCKPLNLPVRSLRSNIVQIHKPEMVKKDDMSPKLETSGKHDVKAKKIRGVVSMSSEENFGASDGSSNISWQSRSRRMEDEDEDKVCNIKPYPHCRPHSVGELEFNHVKPRSTKVSNFSNGAEQETSRMKKMEDENVIMDPHPTVGLVKDETSANGSRSRLFSVGYNSCRDDKLGQGKQPFESFDSEVKSSSFAKSLSKAKSARTRKPSKYVVNDKQSSSQVNAVLERMCNGFEDRTSEKRGKWEEPQKDPVKHEKKEIECHFSSAKPKPNIPDFFGAEKEDIGEQNVSGCEEEGENKQGEVDESCDEGDDKTSVDFELDSEVDRKAAEFIAKFRQQIQLQKA